MDQQTGQIYESIEYRMKFHQEKWLIIVTTDHGRDATTGKEHDDQNPRERTTWIVTNYKETNNYFEDFQPAIIDILPTMARFMDLKVPIESERELDGVSLIGKVSIAKPHLNLIGNTLTVKWKALDNSGNVKIW